MQERHNDSRLKSPSIAGAVLQNCTRTLESKAGQNPASTPKIDSMELIQ